MCGIVGYVGSRDATPIIYDGLKRLEYRGYDSAGLAIVHDGSIEIRRVTPLAIRGSLPTHTSLCPSLGCLDFGKALDAGNALVVDESAEEEPDVARRAGNLSGGHPSLHQGIAGENHAHRHHADADAEHHQHGAGLVAPQISHDLAVGDPHSVGISPFSNNSPSNTSITRGIRSASEFEWVTITKLFPRATSFSNASNTP